MNESETRAELIDPKISSHGWVSGTNDVKVYREYQFTAGRIIPGGRRGKPLIADYILSYKNIKLAVIEAKSDEHVVGDGVAQAKLYASKLHIPFTYSTNGKEIYQIDMLTGKEGLVDTFPTPSELWNMVYSKPVPGKVELDDSINSNDAINIDLENNFWSDLFTNCDFEDKSGSKPPRYYQEIAVNNVLNKIADNGKRILLTLATGTGKTYIAFQIAWKLFQTRWNLNKDGKRRPRILFLADRNILANQAFNDFSAFPEDALVRIKPSEIKKKGRVPTNGSIFFTIFQTFMSGTDKDGNPAPYFGEYPQDYFDCIIIDECHRGGANDESNWRGIMEYFAPAVQIGLTATPKRKINADTYAYFGEPVYIYSLKEGIDDGFLTPFKVKRIQTTIDDYVYTSDDTVLEGEVEEGKKYTEKDFNRIIEIMERERKRVEIFMDKINQNEKTLVFCATQDHAAAVRDLVNQIKKNPNPDYCCRVTANDGDIGETHLADFQDNEKTIPTILTTSQKLSTGVDARNIRNIVLMRPVNSMIEFKQIIGRGTRLYEGKEFFTIYDFVNAYENFFDPEWDGEPVVPELPIEKKSKKTQMETILDGEDEEDDEEKQKKPLIKIKLRNGKERQIQFMISTSFWGPDGKPISADEFLQNLYGKLPDFFTTEDELRKIWSVPKTREALLASLEEAGFTLESLNTLRKLIDAENSDIFDVLEYIAFSVKPITRKERVDITKDAIMGTLGKEQQEFINFVLSQYVESGFEELNQKKLPSLLVLKYESIPDAQAKLGNTADIAKMFISFQKLLYSAKSA